MDTELYYKWLDAEKEAVRFPTKENRETVVRLYAQMAQQREVARKYVPWGKLKIYGGRNLR
jgi:hypothetical protein